MATQDHPNRLYGMHLSSLISFPLTLRAAIQLDVFQIIADAGPESHLSSSEIAAKLPTTNTHAPAILDRILRVLAANNALTMSRRASQPNKTEWVYGLTSGSRSLVKGEEDGVSMAPLVLLSTDRTLVESFYCLEETVIEGGCTPYERAHGKDAYRHAAEDPSYGKFAQEAMSNCTTIIIKEVLKVYGGFDGVKKMVDVGGGSGTCLSLIVSKYPHIQGVNFDLPQAISLAPQFPGVEHVAGNMFEGVPSSEAIFMRGILHNWDDDQCVELLRNCLNALPNGGMVINVELAVPDPLGTDEMSRLTSGYDLLMMSFCSGGKERTLSEYCDLAKAAGFAEMKAFPVVHGFHVMEFHKAHGVLHNWDDDQCVELLRNCWNALPNGGMVIDVDVAVPDPLGTDEMSRLASGFDLLMMSFCSGGKERTLSEYCDLAKAAGFAEMKAFPVVHGFHVMEFHKAHVN